MIAFRSDMNGDSDSGVVPVLKEKFEGSKPLAYLCIDQVCEVPFENVGELTLRLSNWKNAQGPSRHNPAGRVWRMSEAQGQGRHKASVRIVVDADSCPVKDEVAKVAKRLDLPVIFVANRSMRILERDFDWKWFLSCLTPLTTGSLKTVIPEQWLFAVIFPASRCVAAGANVVDPRGRILDEESVGEALAEGSLDPPPGPGITHKRAGPVYSAGSFQFSAGDGSGLAALASRLATLVRDQALQWVRGGVFSTGAVRIGRSSSCKQISQ